MIFHLKNHVLLNCCPSRNVDVIKFFRIGFLRGFLLMSVQAEHTTMHTCTGTHTRTAHQPTRRVHDGNVLVFIITWYSCVCVHTNRTNAKCCHIPLATISYCALGRTFTLPSHCSCVVLLPHTIMCAHNDIHLMPTLLHRFWLDLNWFLYKSV